MYSPSLLDKEGGGGVIYIMLRPDYSWSPSHFFHSSYSTCVRCLFEVRFHTYLVSIKHLVAIYYV